MKITTIQRNSASPVATQASAKATTIDAVIDEGVAYIQGNRRRGEGRREQRGPLWPGGPQVTFYEPHSAFIESCDGATKKTVILNLDDRTYAPFEASRKPTPEQVKALRDRLPPKTEKPAKPTVLHETTTVDTGERKQFFGYTARHVITTSKVIPLAGSTSVRSQETVTDGWYIDLDASISCDPPRKLPVEGTTYAYAALSVIATDASGQPGGSISVSSPSFVQATYIGKPEAGFPVRLKTTTRTSAPPGPDNSPHVTTMETEVTDISASPLNAALFEVPADFRSVPFPQVLLGRRVAVAWWARWLASAHDRWVRLRKMI